MLTRWQDTTGSASAGPPVGASGAQRERPLKRTIGRL
jgi:hypothetical protein